MTAFFPYPLAATGWLGDHVDEPDIRVVDASWRMPGNPPAIEEYRQRHIPGASFFDLDDVADRSNDLPHMLPTRNVFADWAGSNGIAASDRVVIYDDAGIFSAARVWWTFRAMGHGAVTVLDGGLPKWLREGRATEAGATRSAGVAYHPAAPRRLSRDHEDVRNALKAESAVVLDARPPARFIGVAPEPRPGLRRGHMPGARNLPHSLLLAEDGTMKPPQELRALFAKRGVDLETPVITTCGSGVTAAVIALALEVIGHANTGLYDGSWTEWGRETNDPSRFPIATADG
jgi:thiosulfate/3-mercaptopyruvate sulfurtransferase